MRHRMFAAIAVAAAAAGAPALAQTVVQEITVIGRYVPRGEPPAQLSRVVSFADLDLRRTPDQVVLRHRIEGAADDVCDRLGAERPNHTNLGRSCRDLAVKDALDQMKGAIAYAMVHPPAYVVAVPVVPATPDTAYTAPAGETAPGAPDGAAVAPEH